MIFCDWHLSLNMCFQDPSMLKRLSVLHPFLWLSSVPEAEDIKKRWQEYTEELYKKNLHDPDNHDGVITDLEPDIMECEVQ